MGRAHAGVNLVSLRTVHTNAFHTALSVSTSAQAEELGAFVRATCASSIDGSGGEQQTTAALQLLRELDLDHDGLIGMAEWRKYAAWT